jgi:hypothetical protein
VSDSTQIVEPLIELAPAPAWGVEALAVDGGAVLVDERHSSLYPLNSSGALVWACLDGVSSLGEIARDIADAYAMPYDRVAIDVGALGQDLLVRGLAVAGGYDGPVSHSNGECACCSGQLELAETVTDDVRTLVEAGVWSNEAFVHPDTRYPCGAAGEVVARVPSRDGRLRLVGIRTNDAGAADEISKRLGPLLVDEPFAFANVSVMMGAGRGQMQNRHLVWSRNATAFRSFSSDAAIDAAIALIHTFAPRPEGLLPLRARVLERGGSAVVVAEQFELAIDVQHRRLADAGYSSSTPVTPVLVDPNPADVLVPRGDLLAPELVRVPISLVVVPGVPDERTGSTIPFDVAAARTMVLGPGRTLRTADVLALCTLAESVPFLRVNDLGHQDVIRELGAL